MTAQGNKVLSFQQTDCHRSFSGSASPKTGQ